MTFKNVVLQALIVLSVLLFVSGCSERDELTVAPCSTEDADNALWEAEAKLAAADVSFSLDEPGDLLTPEELIPSPGELGDAKKQANFEEAIAKLNTALTELERQGESCVLSSISDRALLHLQLGFIYSFDAISRLLLSDDPEETFIVEFSTDSDNFWYNLDVSPAIYAALDATKDPLEYPLVFTVKERQAIIDAADLIDDAAVKPREPNIQPQFSSVDRQPYTGSAIWHFQKAANLFEQYNPEMANTAEEFNKTFDKMKVMLQMNAEKWGFIYIPPVR